MKDYGRTRALQGVDLRVLPREVFGFLGADGAGKSTTIRLIMELLRPTAGSVEVFGVAPAAGGPRLRARIGYLPGGLDPLLQRELRALARESVAGGATIFLSSLVPERWRRSPAG